MRVGIMGCGTISDIYLKNLTTNLQGVSVSACSDISAAAARKAAEKWRVRAMEPDELLNSPEIDCILLLTPPKTHFALGMQALSRGKHVYTEKPLAMTSEEAGILLNTAAEKRLRVGCAPDTFLGAGLQTVFSAIDRGMIGKPVAASAFMLCGGHEMWHPNPAFYYQPGGGPLMDMGPYALTALVKIFGPGEEACAMGMRTAQERMIATGPRAGQFFPVQVDTFLSAQVRFVCGAIATLLYSFDTAPTSLPNLEIYGERGTVLAPDPNWFGGAVRIGDRKSGTWSDLPLLTGYPTENMRGIGVAEMACAIQNGRPHQADGETGFHVVAIMEAVLRSAAEGRPCRIAQVR